jgi:hypothetical protein
MVPRLTDLAMRSRRLYRDRQWAIEAERHFVLEIGVGSNCYEAPTVA